MRAPTGAGKTDASLLWAQKQIEDKRAERLVIAMPTRFTSNALAINVTETLSATGLYHSTAWQTRFDDALKTKSITMQYARNEHDLARRLFAPVTVCTIDHLLMALTLTKEDHHQILFNLMNSCLVIDEADFYDAFTQANIQVLLRALYKWNVPVMLMSASLPESSIQFYRKTGYEIKEIKEDKSDLDRPRCHVKKIIDDFEMIEGEMETLLSEALVQDAVIVYANTVDRAIQYYEWFRKKGKEPIVYHSRFVEADKKAKETLLLEMLGKDAKHRKGIAILTQIGEMSVNISTDWMISDICPIDRLVQRAGRLCRFDNNVGQLHIVIPKKGDKLYPAPYGTFKKEVNQWIPHDALTKTIEEVEVDKKYSAGDFVAFINKVYQKESIFTIKEKENAKLLKEFFIENWLIGGRVSVKEDDENAGEWKSRDITGQETVFIEKPENPYFNSWLNYQTLKNEKSIVIPIYLVEKGKKQFYLRTMDIYIGDDKKVATTITYIDGNQGVYSFETGFRIPRERDEFM
jgi:CRISPR-associated endonuclease/helicase Cas3